VKKADGIALEFEVDKWTNSIENSVTGEVFDTEITRLFLADARQIKKNDWQFNWHTELKDSKKEVHKLTTINNPSIIHGLICFSDRGDHVFMHLIESAKFNKGKKKHYKGVAGNLVAFGCKTAFEKGYDGVVSFIAKSQLVEHYKQTLGARLFGGGNRMFIDTTEALKITKQYFKNFIYDKH
jgi:hypothetical protein